MKEICLPFSTVSDRERAEVDIRLPESGQTWHYRIENVEISDKHNAVSSTERIRKIRQYIKAYSEDWELLQIMDTPEGAGYVHLLYRKKLG